MKYIQLGINLTDDLGIESVVIQFNSTNLNSDSELLKKVSIAILQSISLNKKDVELQDLLNSLGIKITNN